MPSEAHAGAHGTKAVVVALPANLCIAVALLKGISASPFLRDAKRKHKAWERRFDRLAR